MQTDAPHAAKVTFNDRNPLPQFRSCYRRLLTSGTASDNYNVEFHGSILNTQTSLLRHGLPASYVKLRNLVKLYSVNNHL